MAPTGTAGSVHFFDGTTTDLGAGTYDAATLDAVRASREFASMREHLWSRLSHGGKPA